MNSAREGPPLSSHLCLVSLLFTEKIICAGKQGYSAGGDVKVNDRGHGE